MNGSKMEQGKQYVVVSSKYGNLKAGEIVSTKGVSIYTHLDDNAAPIFERYTSETIRNALSELEVEPTGTWIGLTWDDLAF